MKAKVTEGGVTIPQSMLPGVKEVEIYREDDRVVVKPAEAEDSDPIFGLGKNPVACGAEDASEDHDKYLYRQ